MMGIVVRFERRHARTSSTESTSDAGQRSGRRSLRETPVSRSIGKTNSAGTPFLDRVSQYQTCDCVVPIRSAKGFWPPAATQARFSASVDDMGTPYPNLGELQPKNLCATTYLNIGNVVGMEKPIDPVKVGNRIRERRDDLGLSQGKLGKSLRERGLRGYSQQNIGALEGGRVHKDVRRQAMDLAEPLRTSVEWLLHGTGVRDVGPRPMTPDEYAELPFDVQMALTEAAANYKPRRKKA